MGHWGTAILSNDNSADIKDLFFSLYDKGIPVADIRKEIEKQFKETDNLDENTDLWLTLALLQWQVGNLDNDVKEFAEKIIDEDIDINVWKESEADEKDLSKRKVELLKLRGNLQTINPKPRKIKKKKVPTSLLKKGEVYAFPLKNNNFSSIIVLEEIIDEDYYFILIANTDVNKTELPTLEDVLNANILNKTPYQSDNFTIRPAIASYTNAKHKEIIKDFIKIGEVIVKGDFSKNYLSFGAAPWTFIMEWANIYLTDNKESVGKKSSVTEYVKRKTPANIITRIVPAVLK